MAAIVAVDAGTTGVRAFAVDETGTPVAWEYREFPQHFPRPGWVEHDPLEICAAVEETLAVLRARVGPAAAIGITNQRETTVVWDRRTGRPLAPAIVWQDRRTAARCDELRAAGELARVRALTGLVLDPYFSATKLEWLLGPGGVAATPDLAFGTVDSWIIWNLTAGAVHATDPSNASRTMLYDITAMAWSPELCALFGVPTSCLPEVRPSSGAFGTVKSGPFAGTPVAGAAGDQQSALFGQACFAPGMAKATYGTGTFILVNAGEQMPAPAEGLLTTVAWDLGAFGGDQARSYALEGGVFTSGAAIQWLRDGLGIIAEAADLGPLAESVPTTEGVHVVPAFAGLGSPWWDPRARGTITGLSRGLGRPHIARAVVEAMAFQGRDVVDTMRGAGAPVETLRVDGGAAAMDLLVQLQADQLRTTVSRTATPEATALGAATLAGLAEGVWGSLDELSSLWSLDRAFEPKASAAAADSAHAGWLAAVERSRNWADDITG